MGRPQYLGQDIPIFTIAPNWADKVVIRTIYETLIRESIDNSEERQSRRPRCLYGISFNTLGLDGQETGYLRSIVELAQAMPIGMPIWTEGTKLTASAGIGDTSLQVDPVNDTLWPILSDYALIWTSFNNWEVLKVESVSLDTITLTDAVTIAVPERTFVLPLLLGKLPRAGQKQITDEHGIFSVDFEERFNGLTNQLGTAAPEITYSECRDEFTLTFTPPTKSRLYCIQSATSSSGPWGHHVFIPVPDDAPDSISTTFNNDYNGEVWFRVVTGTFKVNGVNLVTAPVRPLASIIQAPVISIAHTRDVMEPFNKDTNFNYPRPFWAPSVPGRTPVDVLPTPVHEIPYALSVVENSKFAATEIYQCPRYRVEWRQTTFSGPTIDEFDTRVSVEAEELSITKWTRDGSEPTEDTVIQKLDGWDNNAAVARPDFAYLIRARSFKDGCRSPLTTVMVDKRFNYQPLVTISTIGTDLSGSCDLTGSALTGFAESGESCINNWGSKCAFANALQVTAEGATGFAGFSNDAISVNTLDITTKVDYLGWTNFIVGVSHLGVGSVDVSRDRHRGAPDWDHFNTNAHTFVIVVNSAEDPETSICPGLFVNLGSRKTQGLIGPSKYFPDSAPPIEIEWLGTGRDNSSMNQMVTLGIKDTRYALATGDYPDDITHGVDQFAQINYTMFATPALPYGAAYDFFGRLTLFDILLTVHNDTKFFGEILGYWFTDLDPATSPPSFGVPEQFRSAFYRPYCIYDENLFPHWYSTLVDPDSGINLGLPDLPAWGPIWGLGDATPATGSYPSPSVTPVIVNYAGDDFESYADEAPLTSTLSDGNHWGGDWVIEAFISAEGFDDFESYTVAALSGTETLSSGESFAAAWVITIPPTATIFIEDFESYTVATIARTDVLNAGTGYSGAWAFEPGSPTGLDDFESYAVGSIPAMTGGTGWTAAGWRVV